MSCSSSQLLCKTRKAHAPPHQAKRLVFAAQLLRHGGVRDGEVADVQLVHGDVGEGALRRGCLRCPALRRQVWRRQVDNLGQHWQITISSTSSLYTLTLAGILATAI